MKPATQFLPLLLVPALLFAGSTVSRGQDVTRTVTTRTLTPDPAPPPTVTRTVTTQTSTPEPAPDVTRTVTTRTSTPNASPDGDVTRTVTTKTTFSPSLPHRGLFQIRGTSTFFWVDDFGIRHYVRDPDAVRAVHLPNEPIYLVNKQDIRRLPTGRALTVNAGPDLYLTKRDETAVLLERPHVIIEFGTGPNAKRVEVRDLKELKAVEDFDDLETLTSKFWE
jgi:hypothetical protein